MTDQNDKSNYIFLFSKIFSLFHALNEKFSRTNRTQTSQTLTLKRMSILLTAQRNLGVPVRHAESRVAGRTYENR